METVMSRCILLGALTLGLTVLLPIRTSAQDVYKNVTSAKVEKILAELKIDYKKSPGKKDGVFFYDYTRNGFKIRLHNYEGKDLWIDAIFSDNLSPEEINAWNVRAKFSRAVLLKDNDRTTVSLENQYDCLGGCTDAFLRQFVNRFDGEVRDFTDFVKKLTPR
jgi:hypothetical protein